jgi:hypothetical protein
MILLIKKLKLVIRFNQVILKPWDLKTKGLNSKGLELCSASFTLKCPNPAVDCVKMVKTELFVEDFKAELILTL